MRSTIMDTYVSDSSAHVRTLNRVLIVANLSKPNAGDLCDEMETELRGRGVEVVVFTFTEQATSLPVERFDLAISLGGDGTVLFCARLLAHAGVPILPVNLGHLGFITELTPEEWRGGIDSYLTGSFHVSSRMLLDISVERRGGVVGNFTALNDAVVSSGGMSKAVRIVHLSICAHTAANGCEDDVAEYRADGLIIATPTGSTGYSAAAGGPILHPELDAIIMNPICPFTLNNRPLILPGTEELKVLVQEYEREDVVLTVDGQTIFPIQSDDTVIVRRSNARADIVRSGIRSFYEVLRRKLDWAGGETGRA